MTMTDIEGIETLCTMLGLKRQVIEADVKDLAWLWQRTISEAKFADPYLAFHVLNSLVRSYLRGRNRRMGNHQGLQKHKWVDGSLMAVLLQYVIGNSSFDCLHRVGVNSVREFASALKNHFSVLDEADRILHAKEES